MPKTVEFKKKREEHKCFVFFFLSAAVGSKTDKLFCSLEKKNLVFEIRTLFDEQTLHRLLRTGHGFGFGLGLGYVE